jgi:hypothetical protein
MIVFEPSHCPARRLPWREPARRPFFNVRMPRVLCYLPGVPVATVLVPLPAELFSGMPGVTAPAAAGADGAVAAVS